jgi:hypothetical protein
MPRSRFIEDQMLGILEEHDARRAAAALRRKHGIIADGDPHEAHTGRRTNRTH